MIFELKQHIETLLQNKCTFNSKFDWQLVSGGSINNTFKISSNSISFFVKTNTISVFENGFKEEVLGLNFLQKHTANTPKVILEGIFENHIFLVLEWIETAPFTPTFWKNFGIGLAKLHQRTHNYFGLDYLNFMGQLPQQNTPALNFPEFFIENRLMPQVKLAINQGGLQTSHLKQFENLYQQLDSIFPKEQPAAVHGDLWSGNFICSDNEKAILIDPAVYFGHREVDLAMTHLFGGFSSTFYQSYNEYFPLEKGFSERIDIYNLYPLLIHLNLFGGSYLYSIENIITKF